MEYYSAIKRNAFESVLIRGANLEPIIQSELRQRNINIVHCCIHMESKKKVLMNLFSGHQ